MTAAALDMRTIALGRGLPAQRTFRVVSARTLAQDVWMTRAVRKAKLDDVKLPANATQDPNVFHDFLTALVTRVFEADVVGDLLAGVLVEQGHTHWTTMAAEEIKLYLLNTVTDDEDKRELLGMLSEVIRSFLSSGRKS